MSEDLRDILMAFTRAGVEFIVVGAHALAAHGVPRVTGDVDLWVRATPENANRIWEALREFGAPLSELGIRETDFATLEQVVQLGLPPYRVDILTSISGVDWEESLADRVNGDLFGVGVAFLGKASLIRNKLAIGRDKDLRDVRSLDGD